MKKKILVCFGENLLAQPDYQKLSDKFKEDGFEVHLFDNLMDLQLSPHAVFNLLEHVWKDEINTHDFYFLSNIEDFFVLCYRILHHTFQEFIFFNDDQQLPYAVNIDEVYDAILKKEIINTEKLEKKIFLNKEKIFASEFINKKRTGLDNIPLKNKIRKSQQNIYCYQGQCYMLEPSSGEVVYINLDNEEVNDNKFANFIIPFEIDEKILNQIEDIFELISRDIETCMRRNEVLHKLFMFVRATVLTAGEIEQKYYTAILMAMGKGYGIYAEIFSLSFLLQIYSKSYFYKLILELCYTSTDLNVQNKYFVLFQSKHILLNDREKLSFELIDLETKLFEQICNGFVDVSENNLETISQDNLNQDNVVIFTTQFLNELHEPSLYALEIAKYLIENENKQVYIINTCEYLTQVGRIPFFDSSAGALNTEYTKGNKISYKDLKIPFIQMISAMPSIGGIDGITEFLEEVKPASILNLSDLSVISRISSNYFFTVSILPKIETYPVPIKGLLINDLNMSNKLKKFYSKYLMKIVDSPVMLTAEEVESNEKFFPCLFEIIKKEAPI